MLVNWLPIRLACLTFFAAAVSFAQFVPIPSSLSFTTALGASPQSQYVTIISMPLGEAYTATATTNSGGSWLSVVPPNGTSVSSTEVRINSNALAIGTYTGQITISGAGWTTAIPVTLVVTPFTVVPSSLAAVAADQTTPSISSLTITSPIASTFTVVPTTTSGGNWLTAAPSTGPTGSTVQVMMNPSGLQNGFYSGNIAVVVAGVGIANVPVSFTVTAGPSGVFTAVPSALAFNYQIAGSVPGVQSITATSASLLTFTAAATTVGGPAWLSVTPSSVGPSTAATFIASVSPAGLAAGTYVGQIAIAAGGQIRNIPVTLSVQAQAGPNSVSPTALSFSSVVGQTTPPQASLAINSTIPTVYTVVPLVNSGATNWLVADPASGATGTAVNVFVNPAGLSTGTYSGTLAVVFAGVGTINVPVTFTVTATCSFTITPTSHSVPASPETTGTIQATASNSACSATPTSNSPSWLTITSGSSFTGDGTVDYRVAPNTAPTPRTGRITIGTAQFTVTQAGATGCTLSSDATQLSSNATGGPLTLGLTTSCAWTASTLAPWIQLTSNPTGTGNATLTLQVLANPGAAARTGQLVISNDTTSITVSINQAGTSSGQQTSGLRFVPLEPCRILETRQEYNFQGRTGPFGPPSLTQAETRTLNPRLSTLCPVPPTAKAYALNVTLVPRNGAAADYVTLYPAGDPRPAFWTVRAPDGITVANSAIVRAGTTDGAISVYSSNATDLLIDVFGYFTDDANTPGFTYYPLTPCRVVDTRSEYRPLTGPFGPPTIPPSQRRTFTFPQATQYCQIPPGARAYSLTLTVAPSGPLQYLTAWPSGGAQPNVSSINSPAGRTLANSLLIPSSPAGGIDVYVFDRSDVIIDITGYFAPDDGATGLFYFPVTQCRLHDSQFADEQSKTIPIPSLGALCTGIPATAKGYLINATALPAGFPMPFLTAYPTGATRPNASMLNAFQGQTVTNASIIPAGPAGAIDIFAYRRSQVVIELSGYFGR
jgi:hypothetical protein